MSRQSKKDKKEPMNPVNPLHLLLASRWEKITRCRENQNLQKLHSLEEAKRKYLPHCSPCPICGDSVDQLSWLYYLDPEHSRPRQGGWMTVCDKDENEVDFFILQQEFYPWEIVDAARNDKELQAQALSGWKISEGDQSRPDLVPKGCSYVMLGKILPGKQSCPGCNRSPEELSWFWFSSPEADWRSLAGRAGWMSVCDVCHIQVEFLVQILN